MVFRNRKKTAEITLPKTEEKILEVDASMQGSLVFRDPVNLRINGKFEGTLNTKGSLIIGENAKVKADIIGENIIVSGKVTGNVIASNTLTLTRAAYLAGDIRTTRLTIEDGAILQGKCQMSQINLKEKEISRTIEEETRMTVEELAKYLEVDTDSVIDWAKKGRIPAQREGNLWNFDRNRIDAWIASEKIDKKQEK
ncbi:MAG: polymer-forming cytoskeletal protein [Candidatus Omnitrophota bacterium]